MSVKKDKNSKGRAAKRKGSRAEIKVRNLLRSIYPPELRDRVYRVPLSGGGAVKCDIMDLNDPDSAYEVKCQETLVLHDWWRQSKQQAGTSRTPVLVVTQNYRPFYFLMHFKDWNATRNSTIYADYNEDISMSTTKFMDFAADIPEHTVGIVELDGDVICVIPQTFYLEVKGWQAAEKADIMESEEQS